MHFLNVKEKELKIDMLIVTFHMTFCLKWHQRISNTLACCPECNTQGGFSDIFTIACQSEAVFRVTEL